MEIHYRDGPQVGRILRKTLKKRKKKHQEDSRKNISRLRWTEHPSAGSRESHQFTTSDVYLRWRGVYFTPSESVPFVACEQAHLFGWGAATESWREEWGEEKWACTRAIDFWIPRVRWRTKRSDWLKLTGYRNQCSATLLHFTSREPSAYFVQGAFLELLINSDLGFELKLEQKIAVNCLLEGRDVFAVMPTGFGKSFFSAVLHSDRTEEDIIWEGEYPNSVILVICPLIGPIEDHIKEGQPLGLTCASLQDVNDLFSDNPLQRRHSTMTSRGSSKTDLQRFPNKLNW